MSALLTALRSTLSELATIGPDLSFWRDQTAVLVVLGIAGLALSILVVRAMADGSHRGRFVSIPAVLVPERDPRRLVRHAALVPCGLGLVCFAIALGDPYTSLTREEVSDSGLRIALLIDASDSMISPFIARSLNAGRPGEAAFYTTVGAAEHFVALRQAGGYQDLMALVEFGDEAYVITPFTTDYENLLLSVSLISDRVEWETFPDRGTTIAQAIHQGVALFRAFDFLDASGNLMVILSDGDDADVSVRGLALSTILEEAVEARVPVHFVRLKFTRGLGETIPDAIWQPAVERTGGRFYAASDEAGILRALAEIDRTAAGRVSVQRYNTDCTRFPPFALAAVALWSVAALARLTVPWLRRFP